MSVRTRHDAPEPFAVEQQIDLEDAPPLSSIPSCFTTPTIAPNDAFDIESSKETSPPSKPQADWTKRRIHAWKSPLVMLIFFIIGLAMSLSHCIYYPNLDNRRVGDSESQEEKLRLLYSSILQRHRSNSSRFGTAFSFLAQISLTASVWIAYTQLLWRSVRCKEFTVAALNAMFGVNSSVISFLNIEMLRKLRLGSAIALFAWTLLLPPFFTPATLFIYPSIRYTTMTAPMPYPAIADASLGHAFAYSPPTQPGTTENLNDTSKTFTGPRTIVNLLTTATASLGTILPVVLPYNRSEYSVSFYGPIIKCLDANTSEAKLIDGFLQEDMSTKYGINRETDSAYYSFVPAYNSSGDLVPLSTPRQQTPYMALNQLWMTFWRPSINQNGVVVKNRQFQVCRLHNASYHVTIKRHLDLQSISGSYDLLEEVPFPDDKPNEASNMVQHAYTAVMVAVCDQLVGKFAWYQQLNQSDPLRASQFGVIESPIQRTSLLGSLDLDYFFDLDEERSLYITKNETTSDQRLQDIVLARNRTLDVLIEELSFNTTLSFLHNPLLTHNTNSTVTITNNVNRYAYKRFGLFIPYALANLFTFVIVLIGMYSFIKDGVMPGNKLQDIVSAAEDPEIIQVIRSRKRSVTAVLVKGKIVLRAGPDTVQDEALKKVRIFLERINGRRFRLKTGSRRLQ